MSCQQNSASAARAGARSGISNLAGKAAFAAGASMTTGSGAILGATIGSGFGDLLGPGGSVAGGVLGGALGGSAGYKSAENIRDGIRQVRRQVGEERAWQGSKAGQRAKKTRQTQRSRAKEKYEAAMAPVNAKKEATTQRYQAAKAEWMSKNTGMSAAREKGIKGAFKTPEAKAAALGIAQGAFNVAGRTVTNSRVGADLQAEIGMETYQQAGRLKDRVEQSRNAAWMNSPEGKAAHKKYQKAKDRFKAQAGELTAQYKKARVTANKRYDTARLKFSEKYRAHMDA